MALTARVPTVVAAAVSLAVVLPAHAQVTATADVGVSSVQYDGYLASGAAYLNPSLRYDATDVSLALQGSGVAFESGSHILQGTGAGAWRSPRFGRWRAELSGSAGVTSYATGEEDYPVYGHGLGRIRAHYASRRAGGWAGIASGRSFFGERRDVPIELGAGVWMAGTNLAAGGTILQTWIGDSTYLDLTASVRWTHERFELSGTGGVRTASTGGGNGSWAEGSLRIPIVRPVEILIAGGRYPSDPVRGVIAATYVSAALRVTAIGGGRPPERRARDRAAGAASAAPRLAVDGSPPDSVTLVLTIADAGQVELSADFTDWQPVRLERSPGGTWLMRARLAPGVYRLNVRVDGGAWLVPAGYASVDDDFGGRVGLLVIP